MPGVAVWQLVTALGVGSTFGFMFYLFLSKRFGTKEGEGFTVSRITPVWTAIIAMLALVLFSALTLVALVVYRPQTATATFDPFTPAERATDSLANSVMLTRGTWETVPQGSTAARERVEQDSPSLAERLLAQPDAEMNLGHIIEKNEYAAYAFMMAADVSTSDDGRAKYVRGGLCCAAEALADIRAAYKLAGTDPYYESLLGEISRDQDSNRVLFLIALIRGVDAQNGGSTSWADVRTALDEVSPAFKRQYNIEKSRLLNPRVAIASGK